MAATESHVTHRESASGAQLAAEEATRARIDQLVRRKLAPYLDLLYFFLFLDRQNINFAGLQMAKDLHLSATAFVHGDRTLYVIRFGLGAAEAGFVPGVIYYLTTWLPATERAVSR